MICGGNIYAESKKFKAFIESLSLNTNDTDTDKWRKVCKHFFQGVVYLF